MLFFMEFMGKKITYILKQSISGGKNEITFY